MDSEYSKILNQEHLTSVEKSTNSGLARSDEDILYSSKQGVFKYNSEKNIFEKDTMLSTFYDDKTYISGKLIYDKEENRLWGFNKL